MKYRAGYKYQLTEDEEVKTSFYPDKDIVTHFVIFQKKYDLLYKPFGLLTIKADYAWDGASGPAIDTEAFLTPSLIHDAIYQLIGLGYLNKEAYKELADRLLQKMCEDRGMWSIRAWWVYRGVRRFGGGLPPSEELFAP